MAIAQQAGFLVRTRESIISWNWTKKLLHWIIMSAGTMSECVFLIASLWVSINANVHPFVKLFISEEMTIHITELATTAYVALPECIVGLAVVVTLSHIRVLLYDKKDYRAAIWSILYGGPTVLFLALSLITLGCSVANVTFEMPTPLVVARALAGYMFAFTSLLYTQLGKPQEADRLTKKDDQLAQLRAEMDAKEQQLTEDRDAIEQQLRAEIARIQSELDTVCNEKDAAIREKTALHTTLTQTSESALQAYGDNVIGWLNSLDKTVDIDDIAAHTGINKRRLQNALERGEMQIKGTNKSRIWVPSLREYLAKNAPKSTVKERDTGPMRQLHVIQ